MAVERCLAPRDRAFRTSTSDGHPAAIRRIVIGAVLCSLAVLPPNGAIAQQLQAQPFVGGLSFPVGFLGDPTSPARHFVIEQRGYIRVVVNGILQADPFLNLSDVVSIGPERGLLGMALDPDYATNRRFYVYFTRQDDVTSGANETGGLVLARFTRSPTDPLDADEDSRFDFRWGGPAGPTYIEHFQQQNHNGGHLQFGPDGYLYVGLGDGGGAYDPPNNAQNPHSLLGKILRLDVNVSDGHAQGYAIPPDNPFVDGNPVDALDEIWDLGLRNPWRFSFDDPARGGTGALIIADVGQNRWEEVNYEPAGQGGRNYGWRINEGSQPEFNAPPTTPAFEPLTDPVFEYSHVPGESLLQGASITGGHVYRGTGLSAQWRGRYFFADFAEQRVWSARLAPDTGAFSSIIDHTADFGAFNITSFGVDTSSELFIVRYGADNAGSIYRLCEFTITSGVTTFGRDGGTGTLEVSTQPGCTWSVAVDMPFWVTILSNTQNTGSGRVTFRVAPGAPGIRTARITAAGLGFGIAQTNTSLVPGDLDGNRTGDLLWQHSDGRLAAWLMNGTALFDGRPLGPGSLADPAWRVAASGDFDRDGSRDLIFQHQGTGALAAWLMSGTTLLSGMSLDPAQVADTDWKIRGAGDMDGDGWTDLIWQHESSGLTSVWFMTGTRLREGRLITPATVSDVNWRIVGVGDMNGDGSTDLVWQHQANGLISAWLMNGSSLVSGVLLSPGEVTDTHWKIRALTDLNGDRKLDLIWQNDASGVLSAWLMDGLTRIGDGLRFTPAAVPDTGWQIVGPR